MKLNGQYYIQMDSVVDCIDTISSSLSNGSYYEISDAIRNIKPENAQSVINLIDSTVDNDIYPIKSDDDRFVKLNSVVSAIGNSLYDTDQHEVALFKSGAYGIRISADSTSIDKYVYNVCMHILQTRVKKMCV